ncbi:MAG: hypothetical protein IBX62_02650, partial [Coriobacteriia bacterium]|nr:hypothetical protein [Coriobacteriia bacterium]
MSERERQARGDGVRREPLPLRAEVDESAARRMPPGAQTPKGLWGKARIFLELVKFEHSVFALPYAYIGALYGAA